MPTGYTAAIQEGVTFQQFAMSCARAFGALVMMRDDPSDAAIPTAFEPSDHNLKELEKAREEMMKLGAMGTAECEVAAKKQFDEESAYRAKQIAESNELQAKYEAMLREAKAWVPPSPDHVKMKEFMIEQIESSIKFDCNADYYEARLPQLQTAIGWKLQRIQQVGKNIDYHTDAYNKELERTAGRNKWIAELRESLNVPAASK